MRYGSERSRRHVCGGKDLSEAIATITKDTQLPVWEMRVGAGDTQVKEHPPPLF